jgi:transcription antitermination factor NusG
MSILPASFPCGKRWYAVYTNIRCETRARMGLDALGLDTFLPTLDVWITKRGQRRRTRVERPLLSRYLFVAFDISKDHWSPIRSTDGVENLLCYAGMEGARIPVAVDEAAMARMFHGQRERWEHHPDIVAAAKAGDIMRIISGPFASFHAHITEVFPAEGRADAEVEIFGRWSPINIELDELERL